MGRHAFSLKEIQKLRFSQQSVTLIIQYCAGLQHLLWLKLVPYFNESCFCRYCCILWDTWSRLILESPKSPCPALPRLIGGWSVVTQSPAPHRRHLPTFWHCLAKEAWRQQWWRIPRCLYASRFSDKHFVRKARHVIREWYLLSSKHNFFHHAAWCMRPILVDLSRKVEWTSVKDWCCSMRWLQDLLLSLRDLMPQERYWGWAGS